MPRGEHRRKIAPDQGAGGPLRNATRPRWRRDVRGSAYGVASRRKEPSRIPFYRARRPLARRRVPGTRRRRWKLSGSATARQRRAHLRLGLRARRFSSAPCRSRPLSPGLRARVLYAASRAIAPHVAIARTPAVLMSALNSLRPRQRLAEAGLVAKALSVDATKPSLRKALTRPEGLSALIVQQAFGLSLREALSPSKLRTALALVAQERAAENGKAPRKTGALSTEDSRKLAAQLLQSPRDFSTDARLIAALSAEQVGAARPEIEVLRLGLLAPARHAVRGAPPRSPVADAGASRFGKGPPAPWAGAIFRRCAHRGTSPRRGLARQPQGVYLSGLGSDSHFAPRVGSLRDRVQGHAGRRPSGGSAGAGERRPQEQAATSRSSRTPRSSTRTPSGTSCGSRIEAASDCSSKKTHIGRSRGSADQLVAAFEHSITWEDDIWRADPVDVAERARQGAAQSSPTCWRPSTSGRGDRHAGPHPAVSRPVGRRQDASYAGTANHRASQRAQPISATRR